MSNMTDRFKKGFQLAPITMIVIMICVIIYLVSFILFGEEMNAYEGIAFGAYNPLYVAYDHEYFRLLTANFIHFGFMHLLLNCYSLYSLGTFIEMSLKRQQYIIVLVVSALTTTGIPYCLYLLNGFGASSVSGGISGVVFGLIGALIALALRYHRIFSEVLRQLAPSVIVMLLISFVVPSISMSGHISGLIGGFVATYILTNIRSKKNNYYIH